MARFLLDAWSGESGQHCCSKFKTGNQANRKTKQMWHRYHMDKQL
ncbi:MAG: hypothetical protein FD166_1781 [Bacteroidetes bacterium]|nr:MAG: hypothetical protein FD166_1781 [Bacteroidota bacterium]